MSGDRAAVVSADPKVCGIDGLRVVDASLMPEITTANTYVSTLMIAAQATEMILNDAGQAQENAD